MTRPTLCLELESHSADGVVGQFGAEALVVSAAEVRGDVAGKQLEGPVPPVAGDPLSGVEEERPEAADIVVHVMDLSSALRR